jgi:hypothetical protein
VFSDNDDDDINQYVDYEPEQEHGDELEEVYEAPPPLKKQRTNSFVSNFVYVRDKEEMRKKPNKRFLSICQHLVNLTNIQNQEKKFEVVFKKYPLLKDCTICNGHGFLRKNHLIQGQEEGEIKETTCSFENCKKSFYYCDNKKFSNYFICHCDKCNSKVFCGERLCNNCICNICGLQKAYCNNKLCI